jgi:putative DNA methylase
MPEANPSAPISPVRPSPNARGLTAPARYGAKTFGHLFTARQRLTLATFATVIKSKYVASDEKQEVLLASLLALGRSVDQTSAHVSWIPNIEAIGHSFPRQALQMVWDFVESVPIGDKSANYDAAVVWIAKVIELQGSAGLNRGQVQQADARRLPLPDDAIDIYFTDPPYYDAVPYSDLSDFFLVWLKTALPESESAILGLRDSNGLSPKAQECVWNQAHQVDGRPKDKLFFEKTIQQAFSEGRRSLRETGIACVVFAHKTTEGWEALLNGLTKAGWVIGASWPIVTERGVRTNAQNTASLASSVHLVCRPRTSEDIGDWSDVFRELPRRVANWMERLQGQGVRGADLVFACIGPALEIYSRYTKVLDAEDREIPLGGDPTATEPHRRGYLAYVWEVVARAALEQVLGTAEARARNGAAEAVEEDARLTALFLWTLQGTSGADEGRTTKDDGEDREGTVADEDEGEDEEGEGAPKKCASSDQMGQLSG